MQVAVYIIDSTDVSRAGEVCHIEGIFWAVMGNTKTSGYLLAGVWGTFVGVARKSCTSAGNIKHLALREFFVKVLSKPDRPMITQSLFCSPLVICVHF